MLAALAAEHEVLPAQAPGSSAPDGSTPDALTRIGPETARVWGFDWPRPQAPRASAVLMLFGALDSVPARSRQPGVPAELDVLLTQRAATLSQHAGQVAFPGGRVDEGDDDVVATALREAREETGLDPAGVEVLGVLPPVPVVVSGHIVHPVLAWWRDPSTVAVVDRAEATDVFRVPVADLVDPSRRVAVARPGGRAGTTPGFRVQGRLVWGFTAALLSRVLELAGWARPWDAARVVDPETGALHSCTGPSAPGGVHS
ncbi:CoA pyrophosphatase [Micrococcus sp.]|uniref:NUDIX hydrolase n=1 Tax=Micrococcus sp. TaxID=1271 RepID=UPI002A918265|nr:CoA pyrophosphatase [Micrococcus sp.]MDY6055295.1 CoA pyrophosphatase [Micrococcus sp.]